MAGTLRRTPYYVKSDVALLAFTRILTRQGSLAMVAGSMMQAEKAPKGRDLTTAKAFRAWRKEAGFSQEQIAVLLGRSLSSIARWELGRFEPPIRDVRLLEQHRPGLVARIFAAPSVRKAKARPTRAAAEA